MGRASPRPCGAAHPVNERRPLSVFLGVRPPAKATPHTPQPSTLHPPVATQGASSTSALPLASRSLPRVPASPRLPCTPPVHYGGRKITGGPCPTLPVSGSIWPGGVGGVVFWVVATPGWAGGVFLGRPGGGVTARRGVFRSRCCRRRRRGGGTNVTSKPAGTLGHGYSRIGYGDGWLFASRSRSFARTARRDSSSTTARRRASPAMRPITALSPALAGFSRQRACAKRSTRAWHGLFRESGGGSNTQCLGRLQHPRQFGEIWQFGAGPGARRAWNFYYYRTVYTPVRGRSSACERCH